MDLVVEVHDLYLPEARLLIRIAPVDHRLHDRVPIEICREAVGTCRNRRDGHSLKLQEAGNFEDVVNHGL